jgi:hypothetical protein
MLTELFAWLTLQVDWVWLVIGLLVGWNLIKQPVWVSDILTWVKTKVLSIFGR